MSGASGLSPGTTSLQTDVAVYLGDCSADTLFVVCDGSSIESRGSTWQRAILALAHPTPPGPYPVAAQFTIFVHETSGYATTDLRAVVTFRIDVRCEGRFAFATVQTGQSVQRLPPCHYVIGDDVVTASRRVLEAALARPGL
ncbi:hypothetical protein LMG22037_05332 [Paraburkholderia phenoliruptrix]|uniref:Uncharacterized protein n=1 Tax=Paraburkholderia phenoliruptrix TaxID=252970 RepID=A0A6J5C6A5_9BURK|nr:hypothetical protein LMG22037_05332 [Paraburkholderia phenoliruptrix]